MGAIYSFPTPRPTTNDGEFSLLAKIVNAKGGQVSTNDNERSVLASWLRLQIQESIDPDAEAFFIRAGITDGLQQEAVNDLVVGLKAESLWTKLFALYPFVGGNAAAHAENLISAAYQITWHGAVTHNANGITGNGTTGYGHCVGLDGPAHGHLCGMSAYIRVADSTHNFARIMGHYTDSNVKTYMLDRCNIDGFKAERWFAGALASLISGASITPRNGLLSGNRTSTTLNTLYLNGVSLGTATDPDTTDPDANDTYILVDNSVGTPVNFTSANLAMAAVHQGLTGAEALAFYNLIEAYEAALSRAATTLLAALDFSSEGVDSFNRDVSGGFTAIDADPFAQVAAVDVLRDSHYVDGEECILLETVTTPQESSGASATDNFDSYADNALLEDQPNWDLVVNSNRVINPSGTAGSIKAVNAVCVTAYVGPESFANNAISECTIGTLGVLANGVACRCNTSDGTNYHAYADQSNIYLGVMVGGSASYPEASVPTAFGSGTKLRMWAEGAGAATRLFVEYDAGAGWVPVYTDVDMGTYLDGPNLGISGYNTGDAADGRITTWSGYDQ